MVDKTEWDELGPYCKICGAHMGELYNERTGDIKNPHDWNEFGDNTCPECDQRYTYGEGDMIVLSDNQREILRRGGK